MREPEFRSADVALLRGWLREDLVPRGEHGHPLSEAMSSDADPSSRAAKYRYVAGLPVTDFAQDALNEAREGYRRSYPDADLSALRWRVEKVDL